MKQLDVDVSSPAFVWNLDLLTFTLLVNAFKELQIKACKELQNIIFSKN